MSDQALTVKNSAVAPWASRQEVRELEERIRTMLPGGGKLSSVEVFGLAQAALAHGLDPFNGEIWCIPGKGLMAGIKGHRRAGHQQINKEANGNGNYNVEFFPLNPDEMAQYKIPKDALAFRCRLHDSQTMRNYVENVERMLKAGMPWEVVSNIMGERPYTEGIGYWLPSDQTKMTPVQCAQKRAEAEALKRRFDLPFTMVVGVNGDSEMIDAEFSVREMQSEQDQADVEARSKSLYGDGEGLGDLGPKWTAEWTHDTAAAVKTFKGNALGTLSADQLLTLTENSTRQEIKSAAQFLLTEMEQKAPSAEDVTA